MVGPALAGLAAGAPDLRQESDDGARP
jgi:hypothetical protein